MEYIGIFGKRQKKPITYQVDWLRNDFCYRTTVGVPKEDLKNIRATAKCLGEKVKITKETY